MVHLYSTMRLLYRSREPIVAPLHNTVRKIFRYSARRASADGARTYLAAKHSTLRSRPYTTALKLCSYRLYAPRHGRHSEKASVVKKSDILQSTPSAFRRQRKSRDGMRPLGKQHSKTRIPLYTSLSYRHRTVALQLQLGSSHERSPLREGPTTGVKRSDL